MGSSNLKQKNPEEKKKKKKKFLEDVYKNKKGWSKKKRREQIKIKFLSYPHYTKTCLLQPLLTTIQRALSLFNSKMTILLELKFLRLRKKGIEVEELIY